MVGSQSRPQQALMSVEIQSANPKTTFAMRFALAGSDDINNTLPFQPHMCPASNLGIFAGFFRRVTCLSAVALALLVGTAAQAQTVNQQKEEDFYRILSTPVVKGMELEVGGMALMPDGRLGVATRKGDIYILTNPELEGNQRPYFQLFASGLHEPLGLAYHNGHFVTAQRGGLTRLVDHDGDGKADLYENLCTFPLSGHYHEYGFGPVYDKEGYAYVSFNVAFGQTDWWNGKSLVPWRGWTARIHPDGKLEPWAAGVRSPAGLGMLNGSDFMYTDNQGDWVGSGSLVHLEKGDFVGHPASLAWSSDPNSPVQVKAEEVINDGAPLFEHKKAVPSIKLPAVWLPHSVLGISTSEVLPDSTGGKFGPFAGQVFIGDQGQAKITRVFLEKVKGKYQGAAFGFREGFASGVLRLAWSKKGNLFVGCTDRGWKSSGPDAWALQRLVWTGKIPFELKEIKAQPDGFLVNFTEPADIKTAQDPSSWHLQSFTYKHHSTYGSPIINQQDLTIKYIKVSEDGMSARLVVDGLRENYIHEIKAEGVLNRIGQNLLHEVGYYTLNNIPDGEKLTIPAGATAAHDHGAMKHDHSKMLADAKKQETKPATTAKANAKLAAKPAAAKPKEVAQGKRPTKMPAAWGGKVDQVVNVGTTAGMKFDMNYVEVKAGSKIKWVFTNYDDMIHNLLVVGGGQHMDVAKLAMKLGLDGLKKNYVPETPMVLFHTRVLQPQETDIIYFNAPTKPGNYTFVCTLPGHAASMNGTLKVNP